MGMDKAWCQRRWLTHGASVVMWMACAHAQAESVPDAGSASAQVKSWGLKDLILQVRTANKDIRNKQIERDVSATGIDRAVAAFMPMATLSATNGVNRQPSTYEEKLSRATEAEKLTNAMSSLYMRDGQDYAAGVSQLLPSGAKLEAKTTLSQFITNINQNDATRPVGAKDNRSNWGLTLTQPLAKDGGVAVTLARAQVVDLDLDVAKHTLGETESSIVAEAVLGYFELVMAQHRVNAALEKIQTAQRLLSEARALSRQGRLADIDVVEVENSLSRFRAGLSEAKQGERERLNRLNTLIMAVTGNDVAVWKAAEDLPAVPRSAQAHALEAALRTALESRHDYLMQKKILEREGVQLVYAKNQALPRIDLVASYGQNGLAYAPGTAFGAEVMRDYATWSLGLQLQVPLGGNLQGRADVAAANLRRENALLAIKSLEVQISNDIDTGVHMRNSAIERWVHWQEVAVREQLQLDVERKKFNAGRSEIREVLMREEKTINSRLMVIEQQLAHARAQVILESAQGILLQRWPS
jgi:outer membrane protein TolC